MAGLFPLASSCLGHDFRTYGFHGAHALRDSRHVPGSLSGKGDIFPNISTLAVFSEQILFMNLNIMVIFVNWKRILYNFSHFSAAKGNSLSSARASRHVGN